MDATYLYSKSYLDPYLDLVTKLVGHVKCNAKHGSKFAEGKRSVHLHATNESYRWITNDANTLQPTCVHPHTMSSTEALQSWLTDSVQRLHLSDNDSVLQWLVDLRSSTDTECMCVLQGKSLTADASDVVFQVPKTFSDHIDSVLQCSNMLTVDLAKLRRRLAKGRYKKVRTASQRVVRNVNLLLETCSSTLHGVAFAELLQFQQQVRAQCQQLDDYVQSHVGVNGHKPDRTFLDGLIASIDGLLNEIGSWTIDSLIKNLLDNVRNASNANAAVDALGQLIIAGIRQGEPLCRAVASNNGVRQLVELLYGDSALSVSDASSRSSSDGHASPRPRARLAEVKAQIMRTLATLCCVEESVIQLHEMLALTFEVTSRKKVTAVAELTPFHNSAGGIDCLCDILCDGGRSIEDTALSSERVKCEAAGLLAQITSPQFARSSRATDVLYASFIDNIADLVNSLTGLCRDTASHEVFLLACAALANMSLLDTMTCDCFVLSSTVQVLLEASSRHVAHSLFVKDQIITVLACMASVESCSKFLGTQHGVAELLVQYVHERPRPGATSVEQSACERLQQKSAIAISRICNSEEVGLIFIELHCVPRLVELCNDPLQRNHSDAVRLSCLMALRKLCAMCGSIHESVQSEEVQRLVQFSVVDSFVHRTADNESFI